ncbi:MAG TPA: efflux RND transporter periplasmic adaptor subunit [Chthoniobacteraceae bacterium]|nr:efflux RND transporter periplasmic adaptor subunit [Chthoniobacteraceae bacterium]
MTLPLSTKAFRSLAPLLLAATALSACKKPIALEKPTPPAVTVTQAAERKVDLWHEYTGRIEAVESVEVRSRVSGHLEEIRFKDGDDVKKGDVLFVIDKRSFENQYQSALAELDRVKASRDLARTEAERAEKVFKANAMSREEYEKRAASFAEATSVVATAEATLANAKLQLDFAEITSPIDGIAGRHLVSVGNLVATDATPLTTLVSADPVYAYFKINESRLLEYMKHFATEGAPETWDFPVAVGLMNDTGFPHPGKVDYIDNQVDPATGTLLLRATVPNPKNSLVPGLFARIRIASGQGGMRVVIPPRAVTNNQDRKVVYVVGANQVVEERQVELGPIENGERVILSGLKPGETFIVDGLLYARPGAPVTPTPLAAPQSPAEQTAAAPSASPATAKVADATEPATGTAAPSDAAPSTP